MILLYRSRKLIHHPSLADFGPKRQIVVDTKSGKEKDQKTNTKHKRKEKEREKRKLERRQSVAVMETVKNSVKKKTKAAHILKSPKYMKSSNRKLVSETPSHKQKSQNMWKRLEKERRRTQSVIDVKVVAESPVKLDVVEKLSPSQKKQAVRRSFYSAGPVNRSRSLTNSLELADRIAGRTSNFVKKAKRQSLFNLKSPDRNSSFLLSQLMSSPSSVRKTPGKKLSLSKALQSPCQNTRSKTPSKALSSQKSLFKEKSPKRSIKKLSFTPVKMSSQEVLIPDSPCLNTRSHTPNKGQRVTGTPSRSLTTNNLLMSPSQNTRSKIASTPTRHSVKAKLFMKSPENTTRNKTPVKFASPHNPQRGKRALNLNDVEIEANDAIVVLTNQNLGATEQLSAYQIETKPEKEINIQPQAEKTPSPTKRMVVKTPSSIDSWPRKKKWTKIKHSESPKLKIDEQNFVEENGSLKSSQSNGSSSGDDEVGIRINDKLDTDDRLQLDINNEKSEDFMFCKPRTSSKRSLAVSPEGKTYDSPAKRRCFSPLKNNIKKQDMNSGTLDDDEKILLKTYGKRNLSLSPEKSLSSPNKRQRISLKSIDSPKQGFSLHSQLLSKNLTDTSDVLSSQGFDTNVLNSQGSFKSQDFLSLTRNESMEYFSASNDEVFLSPTRRSRNLASSQSQETENAKLTDLSNISFVRTDSPVFGSSKKKKLEKRLKNLEIVGEQDVEGNSKIIIKSPCSKVLQSEDGSSKISPSARKYSPSVSAKSLCHLISSPILNSPATREGKEDGSPKIDQDSLNVRRQKMSGRIRRSLMQN
ncbi:unnamed protein product [Mytilus coruscus]|uniref:Uncharacterized protein n=1 Tax=Mytilus coruscus TaxID=42192 RepID=A0A6J8CLZ6_MYTCO|nr:unnamed protein product [Mytilus coruscus]